MSKKNEKNFDFMINDEIEYVGDVRLIDAESNGKVVSINDARKLAAERMCDLICINPMTKPMLMRIDNYEKYIYSLKKNAKKNKPTVSKVKEIQLKVNISDHDIEIKVNHAKKFIEEGDKVKVVLMMKGRELSRREENKKTIYKFLDMISDVAVPESLPKDENTKTIAILKKRKS